MIGDEFMSGIQDIDTPALLVDQDVLLRNLHGMQEKARKAKVSLRPHTKTHRTPAIALMQIEAGAKGIAVAKVGEAEVMAENGLDDILIANEIFGRQKMERLKALAARIRVMVGVDNREQVLALSEVFEGEDRPAEVLIEVETGEERSGILPGPGVAEFARFIAETPNLKLKGIFSHEGHTYNSETQDECVRRFRIAQEETLYAAQMIRDAGIDIEVISVGATPSLLIGEIMPGISEIRPGTYIFMDAAQAHAIGDYSSCAATVLATVISKPTPERVVLDAGVKALTCFTRETGICRAPGYGLVKGSGGLRLSGLYDEHGLINDSEANSRLSVGDKIEIIPNHICPTCNLYEKIYLVREGMVIDELPVLCRGKSQ